MATPIQIRIVATADIGSYIAADNGGGYIVLTLDDTKDINIGDVLSGVFDGQGSLFYSVRNVTQGVDVRICLENWECSLDVAIESLLSMMRSRTGVISAGAKRFVSDSDDVVRKLQDEIRRF